MKKDDLKKLVGVRSFKSLRAALNQIQKELTAQHGAVIAQESGKKRR